MDGLSSLYNENRKEMSTNTIDKPKKVTTATLRKMKAARGKNRYADCL